MFILILIKLASVGVDEITIAELYCYFYVMYYSHSTTCFLKELYPILNNKDVQYFLFINKPYMIACRKNNFKINFVKLKYQNF